MSIMMLRNILFSWLMLLVEVVHGQQAARNDDIQVAVEECRSIQKTLKAPAGMRASGDVPEADDITAAGHACDRLSKAISTSDPTKIQPAAAALRAILARLGMPPCITAGTTSGHGTGGLGI
jgi:hypothetical protein